MNKKIFISLTHDDEDIAEAVKYVLHELIPNQVELHFSTSKKLDEGIRPGEDWISWIGKQVKECDFVLMLMTPTSARKPWILWEGGAVYGAALAAGSEGLRKIRPLLYRIAGDRIPSPLRDLRFEYKQGDHRSDIITAFEDIVEGYREVIPHELYLNASVLLLKERQKPVDEVTQEAQKSLPELKDSRAVISAYFRMVDTALNKATVLVPPEYWHQGLFHNTLYPITAVLVVDAKEGAVAEARIEEASWMADVFYGFQPNSGALVGKTINDLLEMLKNWMDPHDFDAFVADQKRNVERLATGKISSASVPIIFNDKHPSADLRGKSFLPVALHQSPGEGGSFMTILYLDLKQLPSNLTEQLQLREAVSSKAGG